MGKKFLQLLLAFILILAVAAGVAILSLASAYRSVAKEVCQLIDDNYFRRDENEVRSFLKRCFEEADSQNLVFSRKENIERINARLSALRTSHLSVYSPAENTMMWEHRSVDTGIRSRFIEDQLIVFRVLAGSAAEKAGVKIGDSILRINAQQISAPYDAQITAGRYDIDREGVGHVELQITPVDLKDDMSPTLTDLGSGVGQLRIPSFLGQYFEEAKWLALAKELSKYRAVVIDLRDNAGGSFPAMLRAASPFRCGKEFLGSLRRATNQGQGETDLRDALDVESQLEQINASNLIHLKTFKTYGCYSGKVVVLIDNGTASTAEIFAESFKDGRSLLGQTSSGEVVLAEWFPLETMGDNRFSISIPIAGYRTKSGQTLEEIGVEPDKKFYYELLASRRGQDTWLERAKAIVSK